MSDKDIGLVPIASGSSGESNLTAVQTPSNELKPVSVSVLLNRFSTKGQRIAMVCGYICKIHSWYPS